jgi:hypothetical protein
VKQRGRFASSYTTGENLVWTLSRWVFLDYYNDVLSLVDESYQQTVEGSPEPERQMPENSWRAYYGKELAAEYV